MKLKIKRVYETPAATDGTRVLVERLWPRGLSKPQARVDLWLKDIAPTTGLRKWFAHDPDKWPEFQRRYLAELQGNPALAELESLARKGPVTLVYAARDEEHNGALVLKEMLEKKD